MYFLHVSETHRADCCTDALSQLTSLCHAKGIKLSGPLTLARILDKLISEYIEPECIQPTFLYNHPLALSPLAKDVIDIKVSVCFFVYLFGINLLNHVLLGPTSSCKV